MIARSRSQPHLSRRFQTPPIFFLKGEFQNIQKVKGFKTKLLDLAQKYEDLGISIEKIEMDRVAFEVTAPSNILYDFQHSILPHCGEKATVLEKHVIPVEKHQTGKKIEFTKGNIRSINSSGKITQLNISLESLSQPSQKKAEEYKQKIDPTTKLDMKPAAYNPPKPTYPEENKTELMWRDRYLNLLDEGKEERKRLVEENARLVAQFKNLAKEILSENDPKKIHEKVLNFFLN